jgi:hypothetical protein
MDMHPSLSETPVALLLREEQDAYALSAEFYDVLQVERDAERRLASGGPGPGTSGPGPVDPRAAPGSGPPLGCPELARSERSGRLSDLSWQARRRRDARWTVFEPATRPGTPSPAWLPTAEEQAVFRPCHTLPVNPVRSVYPQHRQGDHRGIASQLRRPSPRGKGAEAHQLGRQDGFGFLAAR